MKGMKKFLAVVLALIIILLYPILLISTMTLYRLFTPTTIKQIIRASELGEQLPSLVVSYMENNQETEGAEVLLDTTTTAEFVSTAFSPATVYGLTDTLVDAVGRWWGTDQPIERLDLQLDISSAKQQLVPAINERFGQFTQDLPLCDSTTDPGAVTTGELDFSTMFTMTCLPATMSFGEALTQNIPNTVNAQDLLQQQVVASGGNAQLALINQQVDQYRLYWKWLHWVIWLGWGTIGLFFIFIILLRLHPRFTPFGWLGWLHVFMTIEVGPIVLLVWLAPRFILPWITGTFDTTIVEIINNALTALLAVYLWPLIWVMVGTAAASIIWFIIRVLVKHHQKT